MKPCNKKPLIIGISLILLMGAVTIYVISKEFGLKDVTTILENIKVTLILPAFLCMFLFSLGEALNIRMGLRITGHKVSVFNALRYAFCGFFFSSITPSASGGQPAQIYFMKKDNINISHGSFSLLFELIGYEIASITIGFLGLCVSLFGNLNLFNSPQMYLLPAIGFFVNFVFLGLILLILFSKKAVRPLAYIAIKITGFFSKKPETKYKILRTFAEYMNASETLKKNKRVFFKVVLVSLVQFCAYHSITFFCYKAFGLSGRTWFEIMTLQGLLFTSVSCIPLPGSSGAMEGGFGLLFKTIFPEAILGSAIILSRILSFVVPLIFSGLFTLFTAPGHKKELS